MEQEKRSHSRSLLKISTGEKPTLEKENDGVRDAIKLVCLLYDSTCQVFDRGDRGEMQQFCF